MLIDFPNYSYANPWQVKTIQTSAPMEVRLSNSLELGDYFALHISWEDILLNGCDTADKAKYKIEQFENFLQKQSIHSKIVWTIHNKTSHRFQFKEEEQMLREVIMHYASMIVIMSKKHSFLVPEAYKSKIVVIPHYIQRNRFYQLRKNKLPTLFRYGANRGKKDDECFLRILNNSKIKKFVSDRRINNEVDSVDYVITKRRFTFNEAELYAQISNFSTYFQTPQFNSGVMNFMIGSDIAVFHDLDSIRYMDLPESFNQYCIDLNSFKRWEAEEIISQLENQRENINDYVSMRTPKVISNTFWKYLLDT